MRYIKQTTRTIIFSFKQEKLLLSHGLRRYFPATGRRKGIGPSLSYKRDKALLPNVEHARLKNLFLCVKFHRKINQVYSHQVHECIFNTCKQYADKPNEFTTWKSDNHTSVPTA